jgi:hypothetical protein
VLRGLKKPSDCPAFGTTCTPRTPLGATMVSAEGACAAYYQYGRIRPQRGGGMTPTVVVEGLLRKAKESAALKVAFVEAHAAEIDACVRALASASAGAGACW